MKMSALRTSECASCKRFHSVRRLRRSDVRAHHVAAKLTTALTDYAVQFETSCLADRTSLASTHTDRHDRVAPTSVGVARRRRGGRAPARCREEQHRCGDPPGIRVALEWPLYFSRLLVIVVLASGCNFTVGGHSTTPPDTSAGDAPGGGSQPPGPTAADGGSSQPPAPVADGGACPTGSACTQSGDASYCLATCPPASCRSGYVCCKNQAVCAPANSCKD
jgi:hypothetical protein